MEYSAGNLYNPGNFFRTCNLGDAQAKLSTKCADSSIDKAFNFESLIEHQNKILQQQQIVLNQLTGQLITLQERMTSLMSINKPIETSDDSEELCPSMKPVNRKKLYKLRAEYNKELYCTWCKGNYHTSQNCYRRLRKCFRCGSLTHIVANCYRQNPVKQQRRIHRRRFQFPKKNQPDTSVQAPVKVVSPTNELRKYPVSERAVKNNSSPAIVSSFVVPDVSLMKPYSPVPVVNVLAATEADTEPMRNASENICSIVPEEIISDQKSSDDEKVYVPELSLKDPAEVITVSEKPKLDNPGQINVSASPSTEKSVLPKRYSSDSKPMNSVGSALGSLSTATVNLRRVGVVYVEPLPKSTVTDPAELLEEEKEFRCMIKGCDKFGEHRCATCYEYDQLTVFCSDKCKSKIETQHNRGHVTWISIIAVHKNCKGIVCGMCSSLRKKKTEFEEKLARYKQVRQNWFRRRNPKV